MLTCSLLHLVAAVRAGVADDELQLLAGVVHKLSLEGPLLGLGGPGEPLVDVEESVQTHRQGDQTPAHRLPDLHTHSALRLLTTPLISTRTEPECECRDMRSIIWIQPVRITDGLSWCTKAF